MNKQTIVKVVACVIGAIVAVSLVSENPVQVGLLAACAGAYIYAEKYMKG